MRTSVVFCVFAMSACVAQSSRDNEISTKYAESIYADYSAASVQNSARDQLIVTFDVRTAASGALTDLAGRSLESIVGSPAYRVEASEGAVALANVRFSAVDAVSADSAELALSVDGFNDVGLPLDEGRYRKLDVVVSIDGNVQSHQAVEFCWSSVGHCVVFDPTIEFLDSIVNGQRRLRSEGWSPTLQLEARQESTPHESSFTGCALASDPRYIAKWLTWGAYTVTYTNTFGITMVTKNIGSQQAGIRCDASCRPAPFGYSNSSSAFANVPFSVDCGNTFASGTTGSTGKFDAETKCSHRLTFSAKADASVKGVGASIQIAWDTQGSVDSNGGQMIDSCGFF